MKRIIVLMLCILFVFTGCEKKITEDEYLGLDKVIALKQTRKDMSELLSKNGKLSKVEFANQYYYLTQSQSEVFNDIVNMETSELNKAAKKLHKIYSQEAFYTNKYQESMSYALLAREDTDLTDTFSNLETYQKELDEIAEKESKILDKLYGIE